MWLRREAAKTETPGTILLHEIFATR